ALLRRCGAPTGEAEAASPPIGAPEPRKAPPPPAKHTAGWTGTEANAEGMNPPPALPELNIRMLEKDPACGPASASAEADALPRLESAPASPREREGESSPLTEPWPAAGQGHARPRRRLPLLVA